MRVARFALGYLVVATLAGLGGFFGVMFAIMLLGGIREPNVWDMLMLYRLGGLAGAAMSFHFATVWLLRRTPPLVPEVALFIIVQFAVGPFAEFVVASDLNGEQGQAIVALTLVAAGSVLAWFSPEKRRPAQMPEAEA